MTDRLTVGLDDDNAEWVEQQHEERDRSKAWVVNEALRAARGEQSTYNGEQHTGEHRTGEHHSPEDVRERLDDLEQRVAELEAATPAESAPEPKRESDTSPDPHHSQRGAERRETTPDAGGVDEVERGRACVAVRADSLRAAAEEVVEDAEVPGRAAGVERTRRDALLWAWDYLREHEHCTSSEIANATLGAFWDEPRLNYSVSPRYPGYGLWDGFLRNALRTLPGVDGPEARGKDWFFDEDA